jgi:hypothetical protein
MSAMSWLVAAPSSCFNSALLLAPSIFDSPGAAAHLELACDIAKERAGRCDGVLVPRQGSSQQLRRTGDRTGAA